MKHTFRIAQTMLLAILVVGFTACSKESTTEDPTDPNGNGGGNNGTFTPPTSSFWTINGTANSSSMDACDADLDGGSMGVSKPFNDLGFGYCQLRVFNDNNALNIRDEVQEGGFITTNSTSSNDSIRVELDVEDQNSNTAGYYFYRAIQGNIFVSKLNGKLRYTSDGVLQMEGVKYPAMSDYLYNCELNFSQEEL
jgi:hypothetical protein